MYIIKLKALLHKQKYAKKANFYKIKQLTVIFTAYVDRFARNWHRLSTTDLSCILIIAANRFFAIPAAKKIIKCSLIFCRVVVYYYVQDLIGRIFNRMVVL